MRQILIIQLLALMALFSSCASAPRNYEDLNKMPGLNNVYVGPTMLKMASSLPGINKINSNAITDGLKSLRIITVSDPKSAEGVLRFIRKEIKHNNLMPELQSNRMNGDDVELYTKTGADSNINQVVAITHTLSNLVVVMAEGNFTPSQIAKLIP